ncbi:MAG: hypothetical protein MZU97_17345 [Bacillus subtilis]|nr:hypothetical protein [Bacillus subtilis]
MSASSRRILAAKERWFVAFAYIPKATVQAAIGSIPLSLGIASGELILTVAVLAILLTAPLGAFLIDRTQTTLIDQRASLSNETVKQVQLWYNSLVDIII